MKRNSKGQFTSEGNIGPNNYRWKGNAVGYYALHRWVERTLGKPLRCEICGNTGGKFNWANKSKKYLRSTDDWVRLCLVCHKRFDGLTKLSKEQALEIKNKYADGILQVDLAKRYSVDQGTISNIIRGKIKFYA